MNQQDIIKAAATAVLGGVIGWSGTAVALSGRVAAIEQSQARIEQRLDTIIMTMENQHGKEATPPAP